MNINDVSISISVPMIHSHGYSNLRLYQMFALNGSYPHFHLPENFHLDTGESEQ
jgi:hypothetical protein